MNIKSNKEGVINMKNEKKLGRNECVNIRKSLKLTTFGFTLVELLAVIVILAIILVIAVPKVMSVIEDAKKATLESTAKMIASQAEKQKVQNTVLGKTDKITCDSVAKINDIDYAFCNITFENNKALVTIKGSGKFEGLHVCNGDKISATATNESCTLVSVTIDLLGGNDNIDYEEKYEAASEVTLVSPTRDGYSFMGWNVTGDSASIADGILKVGTNATKVTAIWEQYSEDYPILQTGPTINEAITNLGQSTLITEISFVDTYTLTGNESEPIDISYNQDESILYYTITISDVEVKVIIVGNGTGGILLNEDSSSMFANLMNLKEIKGMELLRWVNVTNNDSMFEGTAIESVDLGDAKVIGKKIFKDCANLTKINIPNSVTSIGTNAFNGCISLTSIIIPNSVSSMGNRVFVNCANLTSVIIPNSVISIGNFAFHSCTNLTSIIIPNSVTSIGTYAFANCSSLKSITIGNGVTIIDISAFLDCVNLTSVIIPNSVISMGAFAFSRCTSLESITIGNSVTSIGAAAFLDCANLTDVYYTGTSYEWEKISIDSSNDYLINATKHYEYVG